MKRSNEESKEKLDTIDNTAPGSKFQNSQQVQETRDATPSAGKANSFTLSENDTPGPKLKQDVVAKTIKDASYGGSNAGDGLNAAGRSVSGDNSGILGAANMTPNVADKSRADSRYGKKLDRNSTKLNFIPNEQVLETYTESKPLAESADSDQGFNGTYRNEFARSQKAAGNVPGELMFSRSLDLIEKDVVYFGQGQYVRQTGMNYHDSPTFSKVKNAKGQFITPDVANYNVPRGDYLNRSMNIGFDGNGRRRYMTFDSRDITPVVSAADANKSSTAALIARNLDELQRETMDSKAGDEKADIWTPLARAVREPTATVGLLHDIEAITGNEIATAYKKATTSFSFQLNRAHKDGQQIWEPAVVAFREAYGSFGSESAAISGFTRLEDVFRRSEYLKGDASIMVAGYDSTTKYKSKADILIQPRGLRMHLQTADNNMDPFHVDPHFVQSFDGQEVYSTIDRDYDPLLPILMTDKATVVTRLSYADLYTWILDRYTMKYEDSGTYAGDQLITFIPYAFCRKAVGQYLHVMFETAAVQTDPTISEGVMTINNNIEKDLTFWVDGVASPTAPTGSKVVTFTLSNYADTGISILTTARYGKLVAAVNAEKIFPANSGPFYYGYSDLRNEYVTRVVCPLLEGIDNYFDEAGSGIIARLQADSYANAAKSIDQLYLDGWTVPILHSTKAFSLWSFLVCAATPFIITSRINAMRDVLYYEKNVEYPFKDLLSIKDMTTRGYANFNFTDYDHELETKVMNPSAAIRWLMPEFWTKVGCDSENGVDYALLPWYFNETEFDVGGTQVSVCDDASAMSMPSIRSGARLAFLDSLYSMSEKDLRLVLDRIASIQPLFNNTVASTDPDDFAIYKYGCMTDGIPVVGFFSTATVSELLRLPRELGYSFDAPYGLLTANIGDTALTDPDTEAIIHGTSHRVTYWLSDSAIRFEPGDNQAILNPEQVNVNRAANFKQRWFTYVANGKQAPFDHGMVMSVNSLYEDDGDPVTGSNIFKPFACASDGAVSANTNLVNVMSFQKAFWTRIQKLPFVISPFDAISDSSSRTVMIDIFEMAYWFGLCGFRASDYRESVYNREKQVVNQGMLYVSDPWVQSSPLFKDGASSSGVTTSVGFRG